MKNVIVFIEPPTTTGDISKNAGNLYMNRLCIDEDAGFELSGVHYIEISDLRSSAKKFKKIFKGRQRNFRTKRESKIDSALRKAAECNSNGLDLHVISVGDYKTYRSTTLEDLLRKEIQKYKFESVLVSSVYMYRDKVISKENMERICTGKVSRKDEHILSITEHRHQNWNEDGSGESRYEESVGDDLELYFNDLKLGNKPTSLNWTYFLPELNQNELNNVEEKDTDYWHYFWWMAIRGQPDRDELKSSESNSKYISGYCRRKTFRIKNPTFQDKDEPEINETVIENPEVDDRENCCACQ